MVHIEFNKNIQPIVLETEEVPDGATVQLTGWGHLVREPF